MYQFNTLNNFRDLGGLPTKEGRKLQAKRLLRAAEPYILDEADKVRLVDEYGLKLIVDLRSAGEAQRHPLEQIGLAEYHHADILMDAPEKIAELHQTPPSPKDVDLYGYASYEQMICDKGSIAGFRSVFDKLLALENGAALLHCYGGKDRTGIAVAAVLTVLGVDKPDIVKDYMRTNELQLLDYETKYRNFSKNFKHSISRAIFEIASYAQERCLEHAYFMAEKLYGSFDNFVYDGIGVSVEERERMRRLYLA